MSLQQQKQQQQREIEYIELDWEEQYEPLYGSPIIIPVNTMLWRGYDENYPMIGDRFAYYSGMNIVMGYAEQPNRKLGCFVTTMPLKILDIRFMSNILERIIQTNKSDKNINAFESSIISFGLCSLGHQITLIKQRYQEYLKNKTEETKNLRERISTMLEIYKPQQKIEQKGIRVAETINDGLTMTFLQELFNGLFDGFISPRLETAFHTEKEGQLSPELILFNPKMSKIINITHYPLKTVIKRISELLKDKHQLIDVQRIKSGERISMRMYLSGGVQIQTGKHHLNEFEDKLNSKDKRTISKYNNTVKLGKKWRENITIENPDETLCTFQVKPFK